jgi:hypothetical protein
MSQNICDNEKFFDSQALATSSGMSSAKDVTCYNQAQFGIHATSLAGGATLNVKVQIRIDPSPTGTLWYTAAFKTYAGAGLDVDETFTVSGLGWNMRVVYDFTGTAGSSALTVEGVFRNF